MLASSLSTSANGLSAAIQKLNLAAINLADPETAPPVAAGISSNGPVAPQKAVQAAQKINTVALSDQPQGSQAVADTGYASGDTAAAYPNIDPAQELIQASIARYDAQGNISVLKVENKFYQSVLNIVS